MTTLSSASAAEALGDKANSTASAASVAANARSFMTLLPGFSTTSATYPPEQCRQRDGRPGRPKDLDRCGAMD